MRDRQTAVTCNKLIYTSLKDAQTHLNSMRKQLRYQRDHKIPKRAYKCDDCGYWHLTSKETSHKPKKPFKRKRYTLNSKKSQYGINKKNK